MGRKQQEKGENGCLQLFLSFSHIDFNLKAFFPKVIHVQSWDCVGLTRQNGFVQYEVFKHYISILLKNQGSQ